MKTIISALPALLIMIGLGTQSQDRLIGEVVNSTLKCNVIVVEEYLARRQVAESFSGPVV